MLNQINYAPKTLNDFVFSNPQSKTTLAAIISLKLPFPNFGTSGIMLYGTYGTGKTTLARLLPDWIEQAYGGTTADSEYISCQQGVRGDTIFPNLETWSSLVHFSESSLAQPDRQGTKVAQSGDEQAENGLYFYYKQHHQSRRWR